jgi:hypothetical protein
VLIKFINRGKGSAKAAQKYLFGRNDHKGKPREKIQLMRGTPDFVTQVADGLEFEHKYRSAIIAWHPDDNPTEEQMNEILDEFEKLAFAGLEPNQYSYYAVLHIENGAKHIHIVVPRVELQTGRSLNIANPGWQKTYDILRDYGNVKYGWKSPKNRTRAVQPDPKNLPKSAKRAKEMIHQAVLSQIREGAVRNSEELADFLGKIGEITRRGSDYISVKPKGFKKSLRLKGLVYGKDIGRFERNIGESNGGGLIQSPQDREREIERIIGQLEAAASKRAQYHAGRYRKSQKEPEGGRKNSRNKRETGSGDLAVTGTKKRKSLAAPSHDNDMDITRLGARSGNTTLLKIGEKNDGIREGIISGIENSTRDLIAASETSHERVRAELEKVNRELENSRYRSREKIERAAKDSHIATEPDYQAIASGARARRERRDRRAVGKVLKRIVKQTDSIARIYDKSIGRAVGAVAKRLERVLGAIRERFAGYLRNLIKNHAEKTMQNTHKMGY